MKQIIYISCLLFILGCGEANIYRSKASKVCTNLQLSIGRVFPHETVCLFYNDEIILKYTVDSIDGFRFRRDFCIDYKKVSELRLLTVCNKKKYIDTTLVLKKEKYGYVLMLSVPHPKNWKNYYEQHSPVPTKEWGYLPIDSSMRIVSLRPDTIYRQVWTDEY